ncbi:hypothetical protein [Paenibacillus sp. FSL L8-0506]|uniref:hypothetical protein n=1 Tax=Paenibacillus sp. FSL L8-0506 TaxID=2975335 RepID=UPI0030F59826
MAQQQMYSAIANSPGTELSAAITAAVTTIPVVTGSVLPEGPNIITIGVDETSETVLYTSKNGNSLIGCTRGFGGTTAKGWAVASRVARYYTAYDHEAFRKNLTDLSGVTSESTTDIVLSAGQQILNATKNARLQGLKVQGRTLIDLLGGAGSGESLTGWTLSGTTLPETSTAQKKSGTSSIKCATTSGTSVYVQDFAYVLDVAKQYILGCWVYVESYTSGGAVLSLRDKGSATVRYSVQVDAAKVGQWQFVYIKIPTANTLSTSGFRLQNGVNTVGTMVVYFDELRLYAVSAADYAAIGTTITGEAIDRLLPYVPPGINGVDGLWVRRYGKNLLAGDVSISTGSTVKVVGPYSFDLTTTVTNGNAYIIADVLTNTNYTFSSVLETNALLAVFDETGTSSLTGYGATARTFNSGANTKVRLYFRNDGAASTKRYSNWQLELGSTATPFQPREDSLIAFGGVELHANPTDGSEPDVLREVNGRYEVTRLWRKMALDGSLPWAFDVSYTGYKRIRCALSGYSRNGSIVKYDGKPLKLLVSSVDSADMFDLKTAGDGIWITIASADSGWGDSYTPTSDEIKAYFNGWRMYNGASGVATNPYNGTAGQTKGWVEIWSAGNPVGVLPTTIPSGWTPYQLLYRLASPITETVQEDGSLSLIEGDNFIEVGSGYVSRERANPVMTIISDSAYYHFNNAEPIVSTSKFRYPAQKILGIYEDSSPARGVILKNESAAFGLQDAHIEGINYNLNAPYSASYIKLDKSPVPGVTGFYAATEKGQLHDLTDGVTEALARVSVVEAKKAEKDAGPWITPSALLNGFTGNQLSYRKNGNYVEFKGFAFYNVIDAPGGTIIMNLPAGFRPLSFVNIPTTSWGDTGALSPSAIGVYVGIDGIVQLSVPSKRNVLFDGLRFPLD